MPVIPLDYVIALSAGARKLSDFISDWLFVQMTVKAAYALAEFSEVIYAALYHASPVALGFNIAAIPGL